MGFHYTCIHCSIFSAVWLLNYSGTIYIATGCLFKEPNTLSTWHDWSERFVTISYYKKIFLCKDSKHFLLFSHTITITMILEPYGVKLLTMKYVKTDHTKIAQAYFCFISVVHCSIHSYHLSIWWSPWHHEFIDRKSKVATLSCMHNFACDLIQIAHNILVFSPSREDCIATKFILKQFCWVFLSKYFGFSFISHTWQKSCS